MRKAFIATLVEIARTDARVILITGDLGFMALEPFANEFPNRFINVGVAEQNMVGVATGLAEAGFIPFVYSIAPFASLRPYEFIRNGPVWHRFPVRIVGMGGGFEYSTNGTSHYGLEDIAVMRIQPGLTVIAPADHQQARTALRKTWNLPGPLYYRFGKDDTTTIPDLCGRFEMGQVHYFGKGKTLLFASMGHIAGEAVKAMDILSKHGTECALVIVSHLNPSPESDLITYLRSASHVITVEAHYIDGGLGTVVSEIVAENALNCRVKRCGIKSTIDGLSGSQAYMYGKHGLLSTQLARTGLSFLRGMNE